MQVYDSITAASGGPWQGAAVCLGNFDGVHLGHQALLEAARALGRPVVLTFEPHPGKVLQPALAPRLISPLARKLELLEVAGASAVIVHPFTTAWARTPPAEFERALFDELGVAAVVTGQDFSYGAGRAGTTATLAAAAQARGAKAVVVPPVTVDGVVVSSSRIREYLLEGRVEAAARLLGRPFCLRGEVVRGLARGRTIGFPTANVDTRQELRPGAGVYAVRVRFGGGWHDGAANIGVKPTFGGSEVTIEVHVLDFAGDLYGQAVEVEFVARLRSEQRFSGLEALQAQLGLDVQQARVALAAARASL